MAETNLLMPWGIDARCQRKQNAITAVAQSVARKYPTVSCLQVDAEVQKDYRAFSAAPVRDHIPSLIERIAPQSLREITGVAPRHLRAGSRT